MSVPISVSKITGAGRTSSAGTGLASVARIVMSIAGIRMAPSIGAKAHAAPIASGVCRPNHLHRTNQVFGKDETQCPHEFVLVEARGSDRISKRRARREGTKIR